jgi:DNA-binding protein H-NS
MKHLKTITILFIMLLSFSVSAQDKMKEKAIELTKEFNAKLAEEKLSVDQETKMIALFIERQNEIKTIKKDITDEETQKLKIKEVYKSYAKRISDEILTGKQKAALKEYNKNNKN